MTTKYEWFVLIAIFTGPIIAVQVQKWIETYRENKDRRKKIFKTLMATRGQILSIEHVAALNMIDLEFDEKGDKKVVEAWNIYFDHLGACPASDEDIAIQKNWNENKKDKLVDLLYAMGNTLGYDFDKVRLKRNIYVPQGHEDLELENQLIRRGLLQIIVGKRFFPVQVFNRPDKNEPIS